MNASTLIHCTIKRHTEKAVLAHCELSYGHSTLDTARDIWFPKSQVKVLENAIESPVWLANAKLADFAVANRTPSFI